MVRGDEVGRCLPAFFIVNLESKEKIMTNNIEAYDAKFLANEAFNKFVQSLGFAKKVYRGYEQDWKVFGQGDTINIRKPSRFVAQDHVPGVGTNSQDLDTSKVSIGLDFHKEVRFSITDRELVKANVAGETGKDSNRLIRDHILPAANALAAAVDQDLAKLSRQIPWTYDISGEMGPGVITNPRGIMRKNGVPLEDGNVNFAIDPELENQFLQMPVFHSAAIVGGVGNNDALVKGSLGCRFNTNLFVNQSLPEHSAGAVVTGSDHSGLLDGAHSKGATSLAIAGFANGASVKAGDVLHIAGQVQPYAVIADAVLDNGGGIVRITPALNAAIGDGTVVSFENASTEGCNAGHYATNLMFHQNAFALVVAPLAEISDGRGADVSVIRDPDSGLSMRSRIWFDGATATTHGALDILDGIAVVDPNLAVKVRRKLA